MIFNFEMKCVIKSKSKDTIQFVFNVVGTSWVCLKNGISLLSSGYSELYVIMTFEVKL